MCREQSIAQRSTRHKREGKGECCAAINHTNTTRCHVGGNHDRALARLKFVQDPITLVLLLVTVDG